MSRFIERLTRRQDVAFLLLRVGVGVIMTAHGAVKLSDPSGTAEHFASMGLVLPGLSTVLAIAGEFVGGLGLIIGALTRIAALGPLCTMLVAILAVHSGNGLFAHNGGWEYPLTLLLVSLLFVVRGGGPYSLDAWVYRVEAAGHDAAPPSADA